MDANQHQVGRHKKYLAWSRRALLLLKARKLEGFVNGEMPVAKDK